MGSVSLLVICSLVLGACVPVEGDGGYRPLIVLVPPPTRSAANQVPSLLNAAAGTPAHAVETIPAPTPLAAPDEGSLAPANGPLIAIDPGHGGIDTGAVHYDGAGQVDWTEAEANLALALRLRDMLVRRGYRVLLTRDSDDALSSGEDDINGDGLEDHADELQARVDAVNEAQASLLLSLHHNAFYYGPGKPGEDVGGTMTLYCRDREFGEQNLRLANLVQGAVVKAFADYGYSIRDRGVVADSTLEVPGAGGPYLILLGPESKRIARPSEMPAVLNEVLFMTHTREAQLARDPVMVERLAIAFADAVDAFFRP